MTVSDVALLLFALALVANTIALVRHWQMLRIMRIVLNNLIMSQAQFTVINDDQQQREPDAPMR